MARPLRLQFAGALYHVIVRGNERKVIFRDGRDHRKFLSLLGEEITSRGWRCYDYCLMPNHFHLTLETPEPDLARGMQRLNATYSRWFNWRHDRVGHLLQGRYKSLLVDRESYLLELCRYIALNPVRAGLVRGPEEWPWSSYAELVGTRPSHRWLDSGWVLDHFGASAADARAAYRRFVADGMEAGAPWESVKGQIWLGGEAFLARMEALLRGETLTPFPRVQTKPRRPDPEALINGVASRFGLGASQVLVGVNREAFEAAVLTLRRDGELTLRRVGEICGLSPSRICQIMSKLAKGPAARGRTKTGRRKPEAEL